MSFSTPNSRMSKVTRAAEAAAVWPEYKREDALKAELKARGLEPDCIWGAAKVELRNAVYRLATDTSRERFY